MFNFQSKGHLQKQKKESFYKSNRIATKGKLEKFGSPPANTSPS